MVTAAISEKESKVLVYEPYKEKESTKLSAISIENSSLNQSTQTIHLKNISDQVRAQNDTAILQISRLLGSIHFF